LSTILVVRSISSVVHDVAEILRLAELEVVEVFDLYEAAEAARRHRPDVILLEIGHRTIDVVHLGLDILAFLPTVSIVLVAARFDRAVFEAAEELQAAGIVRSRYEVDELLDVVARSQRLADAKRGHEASEPRPGSGHGTSTDAELAPWPTAARRELLERPAGALQS